jgi:hypothetical protein
LSLFFDTLFGVEEVYVADSTKGKQSSKPLQVIGWLGSSGHQTVINAAARGAQKTLRSEQSVAVQSNNKKNQKSQK